MPEKPEKLRLIKNELVVVAIKGSSTKFRRVAKISLLRLKSYKLSRNILQQIKLCIGPAYSVGVIREPNQPQ